MMFRRIDPDWAVCGAVGAIFMGLVALSVWANMQEVALISSGSCRVEASALYQPPPAMVCTSYNGSGGCMVMVPVQMSPYMRDLWRCDGGDEFWRRQE